MLTLIKIVLLVVGIILLFVLGALGFYWLKWYFIDRPSENKRGWRTQRNGRDTIFYQQKVQNKWKSIEIDGEMLIGKISQVLYFKNEEEWRDYPKWAQNRKEIIERIKQDWPPSRTDYENE